MPASRIPGEAFAGTACTCGAIAQLGERLNGIQEVSGSIPLSSTIRRSSPANSIFLWPFGRSFWCQAPLV